MNTQLIKVLISGACGKMGLECVKAVNNSQDMQLVGLVDICTDLEIQAKSILGYKTKNLLLNNDLKIAIKESKPDVVVDFTNPSVVYEHSMTILDGKARPVIGTTGLSSEQIEKISFICKEKNLGCLIAPNFAIGAVLMMQFAQKAAMYMDNAEIVELHHNKKVDAPSGTSIKTAELMGNTQHIFGSTNVKEKELITGARGAVTDKNIHIHSIRLPGLVAHQEVYLAGMGQMLTIRHDSFDRTSFMPGVLMAIRNVMTNNKLIYGLENII